LDLREHRITANHFVLIRSFLIESDGFPRLYATVCAKSFVTSTCALRASLGQIAAINLCNFFFEIAWRANYRRHKNPYFIVFFAIVTMRAQTSSRFVFARE